MDMSHWVGKGTTLADVVCLPDGTRLAAALYDVRTISALGIMSVLAGRMEVGDDDLDESVDGFFDGLARDARFNQCCGLAVDWKRREVIVTDCTTHAIRIVSFSGWVSTLAGGGPRQAPGSRMPGQNGFADGEGSRRPL